MGKAALWDGPAELAAQVERLWERGRLLAVRISGEPMFPLTLRLRRPGPSEFAERFDQVRTWIRALEAGSRATLGHGYELVWSEVNHRQLGRNRVPTGAIVPSAEDALGLIGRGMDAARFDMLAGRARAAFPALADWLARRPLAVLEHAQDWERILDGVAWLAAHPASGLYLRQIDLPGIDTKFIEQRTSIIAELLDALAPMGRVPVPAGPASFEQRFGLRERSPLVRFRILDQDLAIGGLTDLTAPIEQFAALRPPARRVFITENEINGLAFPNVEASIVIFKLGYALDLLAAVPWLGACEIVYWGDIDTHGFAMLDKLRGIFPATRSVLMDVETFRAHGQSWSREEMQHAGGLKRLTGPEQALFDDLKANRFGDRLRLEQERVSLGWLARVLPR